MNLSEILNNVDYILLHGGDKNISHISIDSRNIVKDSLFICISGFSTDGHSFINDACEAGATAIITEKGVMPPVGVTVIKVKESRIALAQIANNFYNNPGKNLKLIGATGTNGKTSITFFIQSIIMAYGKKTGIIGTIKTKIDNDSVNIDFATSTTPDTIELMQILSYMANQKAEYIAMEVTSHALSLYKVESLKFFVSVFTNLTQDHLDLHGTMENYRDAKAKLFTQSNYSVINIDDEYGPHMARIATGKVFSYSIEKQSNIQAKNIRYSPNGSMFNVSVFGSHYPFTLPIPGKFSVYNALGAIGVCYVLGIPIPIIQKALSNLTTVPGRIEKVDNDHNLNIIVDYSHTPDSLKSIILAVRQFTKGNVIIVFGCGGDRDKQKRPIMGQIASNFGDFIIVTSDNPRTEDPNQIIEEIVNGVINSNYDVIVDRKDAIYQAIKIANPDDSIIIAGKGHENYQIFKDRTIYFNDVEVSKKAVEELYGRN